MCGYFACGPDFTPSAGVRLAATAFVRRSRGANWHPQPHLCPRQRTGPDDFLWGRLQSPTDFDHRLACDSTRGWATEVAPTGQSGSACRAHAERCRAPAADTVYIRNVQGNLRSHSTYGRYPIGTKGVDFSRGSAIDIKDSAMKFTSKSGLSSAVRPSRAQNSSWPAIVRCSVAASAFANAWSV